MMTKDRALIEFLDGKNFIGSMRGLRPWDYTPKRRDRGKLEAELAKELRNHIHLRGFQTHRLRADRCEAVHQKAHELEEPGTPDYICIGSRPLAQSAAGRAVLAEMERARPTAYMGHEDGRRVPWPESDAREFARAENVVRKALEVYAPVVFYWEAKREKRGKIRASQRIWIDDARRRGKLVLEAPRSIEDVDAWLRKEGLLK